MRSGEQQGTPRSPPTFFSTLSIVYFPKYHTDSSKPLHHVVFNSAYRDRIIVKGRRRGRKKPHFIETTTKRYFSKIWSENPGRGIFGPHAVYSAITRHSKRTSGHAPKRARRQRARHKQKKSYAHMCVCVYIYTHASICFSCLHNCIYIYG